MSAATTSMNEIKTSGGRSRGADVMPLLLGVALTLGLLNRVFSGFFSPMWFDETFSAVIASQPNVEQLIRWCLSELSGPVHYSLLWAWEKLAGDSNAALRVPSFIFSIAAPLVLLWRGHGERDIRWIWAAVVALWIPGFDHAAQARPYSLLFLAACLQAIAFLRLMAAPDTRRATWWVAGSALMILTHYFAAVICVVQGLLYLARWQGRALRTWPALAALIPVAGWAAVHLPLIFAYAQPDVVWYSLLDASALAYVPLLIFGGWIGAPMLVAGLILTAIYLAATTRWSLKLEHLSPEAALAISGFISFALIFGLGFVHPSFSPRYLLSALPAILFATALWIRWLGRRSALLQIGVLALLIGGTIVPLVSSMARPAGAQHHVFEFQRATDWLRSRKIDRMVYLWDNPTMSMMDDPRFHDATQHNIGAVAGFFFARAHYSVDVKVLAWPRPGIDPNRLLIDRAGAAPHGGILWMSDQAVPGTRAMRYPPRIDRIDPRWTCRDFGSDGISIMACSR